MTHLSRIPAIEREDAESQALREHYAMERAANEISKARAELARANHEADLRAWARYVSDTKEAIRQWGADQVTGLVQQIIADLTDAADEERLRRAYEAARRII